MAAISGSGSRQNTNASPTGSSFRVAIVTSRAPAPWNNHLYLETRMLGDDKIHRGRPDHPALAIQVPLGPGGSNFEREEDSRS